MTHPPQPAPYVQARRALRQVLVEAQNNLCALCGGRFSRSRPRKRATLEHILPVRYGGRWRDCVAAHSCCNGTKAHRLATEAEREKHDEIWAIIEADPRLKAHADEALAVLEAAPSWAHYGKLDGSPKDCSCSDCRALDMAHPGEGKQLLLPIARDY